MTTPQERATEMLVIWQLQRQAGVPPEDRRLPLATNDNFAHERDLEIIRELMERM
jgi:hypothetical protein